MTAMIAASSSPARAAPSTATAPSTTAAGTSKTVTAAPADDINTPARSSAAKSATPSTNGASALTRSGNNSSAGGKDRLLWDYWYTVSVNKVLHYEYYNDHVELKKDRLVFLNHAWKQEEDYINEEQLGVFAQNDVDLSPLFFNFHSTYRSIETSIDGNVKDGKELTVRVRKGNTELPAIKKMVPHKTFFSELFPIWLGNRLSTFKTGQVYSFLTILEDNLESEFQTIDGQVRIEQPDDFAIKTHTVKLTVNYREMKSLWWVEASGAPMRIEMPLQKTIVQRVTKDAAQKFFDDSGG